MTMFHKVLIANRGEVALRILRTCTEMDLPSVLVYSEADRDSLPVKLAGEAYCIGPAPAARSYLNIPHILAAAEIARADAVHPGYGFLAENARFAEICLQHSVQFIGPPASIITRMGNKIEARRTFQRLGIPVLPGSEGPLVDETQTARIARQIGYPVLLKAAAGGGGLGMRIVWTEADLPEALQQAHRQAQGAFGDPSLYLEKYLPHARHIEIQVLADRYGHMLHLGERDCSVQRRHQKLLEESPAPTLKGDLQHNLAEAAVLAARDLSYEGLGTIEFLVADGRFYFIEMNTRLQVEHPVTEMITGLDLVAEQIRVAAGLPLTLKQTDVQGTGHAIECRINAEDPDRDFHPAAGVIDGYVPPGGPGVRVDSHVYPGYQMPSHYDSLIGKLIVWGPTREGAIARLHRALGEYAITGIKTTIPFYERLIGLPAFRHGLMTTESVQEQARQRQEELV